MMGDHEDGIPELSSPLWVDDGEFTPTYDPSPDMPVIFELGLMECQMARLIMNPRALVMVVIVCLVFPHMI